MKLTRRDLIRMGAAGAGLAALGGVSPLLAETSELIEVTVPSSGARLPAVGIGTVSFRGTVGSDDMAPFSFQVISVWHHSLNAVTGLKEDLF